MKLIVSAQLCNYPTLYFTWGFYYRVDKSPATLPYPETDESVPYSNIIFVMSILIFLRLGLSSYVFPSRFIIKTYVDLYLIFSVHALFPAHHILIDFIALLL
jgi:hypothetical protein